MIREFEQYRFARIEGRNVTRARLQSQFKDGINDLDELEKAIALELTMETPCAPWRKSEIEQIGCREGMRVAIHEFFEELRRQMPGADRHRSADKAIRRRATRRGDSKKGCAEVFALPRQKRSPRR